MRSLRFEYETKLDFSCCVTEHSFSLRCMPFSDGRQTVAEPICEISPEPESVWYSRDSFGNTVVCGKNSQPHLSFSFRVYGEARISSSNRILGSAQPFYRFYSPLTQPGAALTEFYAEHKPKSSDILGRAEELCNSVYENMTYKKGCTGVDTTAEAAMKMKAGVCQDYAHILLSLLRTDGICCRYVAGLAFESGETHAWVEVNDGGSWIGIDPTHNRFISDSSIKLCHGRDYSDCPIERGIYLGNAVSLQTVYSRVSEI